MKSHNACRVFAGRLSLCLSQCLSMGMGLLSAMLLGACSSLPRHSPGVASADALAAPASAALLQAWQAPLPTPTPAEAQAEAAAGTALPAAAAAALASASAFWMRFGDPALPALQQAAQAASPNVSAAAARIERARASLALAGAALLPQVSATGSASQSRSIPGQPSSSSASVGLQAGWELDLFGANAAGRSAAQARLRGTAALLADAHMAVAAEVASSLTALRACEAQTRTTQQDADSRAETSRLTELTARAGFTAPADAALARAGAAQARATATQQRGQCDTLVKSLVELTDLPEPAVRQQLAAATAQLPQPPAVLPPALPAELLAQRPDLQQAALAVQAAASDRDQAAALELPQVSLSGSIGGLALRQGGQTQSGSTWSFGPLAVNFPLFDAGARAANTAAARTEYDDAVAQYRAAVRRAVREVEASLVSLQSTAARFDDARSAAADFEAALRATQALQRGGLASLLDLETARRNALAAQSALIELQRERAAAWISLVRAIGADWRTGPEPRNPVAAAKTNPTP